MSAHETSEICVGSYTHDDWSAKMGWSIAGMTFHDKNWNLKMFFLPFLNMENMGKSAL